MALTVWAVDPGRVRRGQLVALECAAVVRDADVGTFVVTVPHDDLADRVGAGWRVVIQDGPVGILSGPIESISPDLAAGTVTFEGVSDLVHLADRLVYPNPSLPGDQQTSDAYYRRTGAASNVLDGMFRNNAGSGAVEGRQVPGLALPVASGGNLGSTVSTNLRYKNLLEEGRALARLGGVTFDAMQEGAQIVVRFRVPVDRSRSVRFSDRNGGVTEGSYVLSAPTATAVLVAGQGEGAARNIIERTRASEWGRRVEVFKDQRDTDDADDLEQSATEQLDEGAAGAGASFTAVEAPGLVYGVDYRLGDIVSVDMGSVTVAEPVRSVELSWDGHGRDVALVLGDHDSADDRAPKWVSKIKKLDARVRGMEVR